MTIKLSAGSSTEEVLSDILGRINDEDLDYIDVERQHEASPSTAYDPQTISAALTAGASVIASLTTAVVAYIEYRKEKLKHLTGKGARVPTLRIELWSTSEQDAQKVVQAIDLADVDVTVNGVGRR